MISFIDLRIVYHKTYIALCEMYMEYLYFRRDCIRKAILRTEMKLRYKVN
jgi:hypothetical protein